jgi:hypothetical protein
MPSDYNFQIELLFIDHNYIYILQNNILKTFLKHLKYNINTTILYITLFTYLIQINFTLILNV